MKTITKEIIKDAMIKSIAKVIQKNENYIKGLIEGFEYRNSNTLFSNFGIDSLDAVEILMNLEQKLDIKLPDDSIYSIKTVEEAIVKLYNYIHQINDDYNNKKEIVLYVIVRTDLPSMNPGKAMAQVAHATTQLAEQVYNSNNFAIKEFYKKWLEQGTGTFGTTIVLACDSEYDLCCAVNNNYNLSDLKGLVEDPTYPIKIDNEIAQLLNYNKVVKTDTPEIYTKNERTCGFVLMGKDNNYIKKLKLYN